MPEDYYLNTLYPLQDKILQFISAADNSFYLTGGTALSRAYLHHRFSDDLDLFVNNDETYKKQVECIFQLLQTTDIPFTHLAIKPISIPLRCQSINSCNFKVECMLFQG
jgi:hypothetical protein